MKLRGVSSVGRARQWHCRGQRFEPATLHMYTEIMRTIGLWLKLTKFPIFQTISSYFLLFSITPLSLLAIGNHPAFLFNKKTPASQIEQTYITTLPHIQSLTFSDLHPITIELPLTIGGSNRYLPSNASLLKTKDGYRLLLRAITYWVMDTNQYACFSEDGVQYSRNFVIDYSLDFKILSVRELLDKDTQTPRYFKNFSGIEDCRLFNWKGEQWFCCTTTDTSPQAHQVSVAKLEEQDNQPLFKKLFPLARPDANRIEKNWMPFIRNKELFFIYSYDPFVVYKPNLHTAQSKLFMHYTTAYDLSQLRGSAPPIAWNKGYLMLVHEIIRKPDNTRVYLHRFLFIDQNFQIHKISAPFTFMHQGVEFCTSLSIDHSGKFLIMPFSVEDRETYLGFLPLDHLNNLLKNFR